MLFHSTEETKKRPWCKLRGKLLTTQINQGYKKAIKSKLDENVSLWFIYFGFGFGFDDGVMIFNEGAYLTYKSIFHKALNLF